LGAWLTLQFTQTSDWVPHLSARVLHPIVILSERSESKNLRLIFAASGFPASDFCLLG